MRHRSMLRWQTLGVVIGCSAFGSGINIPSPLRGAEPKSPAITAVTIQPSEIARWVRELDADSYSIREVATAKLVEAGPAAVEPLAAAILSDSAEVAWRAGTALQRIAVHGDEATVNQVSTALQQLATKRPSVTKLAAEIRVQQHKFRHTRAIAQVRALGGNLDGNWAEDGAVALAAPAFDAIEIVDVEVVPAVAEAPVPVADPFGPAADDPFGPAPAAEPGEEAGGGGLIGLLARLLLPGGGEPIPDAPALPVPAPVPAEFFPAELVPLAPRLEDAPAPDLIPRFEAPELPEIPEPMLPLPLGLVPVPVDDAAAPAPAEAEAAVAEDVAVIAFDAIAAPLAIEDWSEEEGEAYAELTLGKNFRGSDADLAVLKDIPEIYSLSVQGAKLTDKALAHIGELPRLTTLNVRDTEFSSAALRKLRAERPNLSIICRSTAMLGINAGLEGSCILTSVFPRSGAADAGLRDGDEIIEVGGQKVSDFSDLTIAVYPHKAGDKLAVKYRRSGEVKTIDVVLKPRVQVEAED